MPAFSIDRDYKYGISPKLVQQLHGMLLEHLLCASENLHLSSLSGGDVVSNIPGANQVPVVLEGGETPNSRPSHIHSRPSHIPSPSPNSRPSHIPSPCSGETPNSRPSHIPSPSFYLVTNCCSVYILALCLQDAKTIQNWTIPSRLGVYLDTTLLPPNCVPSDPDEASVLISSASEGELGQDNNVGANPVPARPVPSNVGAARPVPSIQASAGQDNLVPARPVLSIWAPEGDGACTQRPTIQAPEGDGART